MREEDNITSRYKNNVESWKKRRESTATYGHHVGHFQAASRHKFLNLMLFQRGDIPTITCYTPTRQGFA